MSSPRWCDGETAEAAASAARDRFGAGVQVSVSPVRVGGLGGFFAREQYRATVLEPDRAAPVDAGRRAEPVDPPPAGPDRVAEALALLSAVPAAGSPATATDQAGPGPDPAESSAPPEAAPSAFLSALAQVQTTPTVMQAVARATGLRAPAPPGPLPEAPAAHTPVAPAPLPEAPAAHTPVAPTPLPEAPQPERHTARVAVLEPAPPDQWVRTVTDLGVPADLVTPELLDRIRAHGAHAAFTHLFRQRLPEAPALTPAPGQVIVVAGVGPDALAGARYLAEAAGLDPDQTLVTPSAVGAACGRTELVVTRADRIPLRAAEARESATATVVAVDVPLPRERGAVPAAVGAITDWAPTSVWAAVDTTRHGRDLAQWTAALPSLSGVVALHVEFADAPASALACRAPVALLDSHRATAARWASVLCERLAGDDGEPA